VDEQLGRRGGATAHSNVRSSQTNRWPPELQLRGPLYIGLRCAYAVAA